MIQQEVTIPTFREGDTVLWRSDLFKPLAGVIHLMCYDPLRYIVSIPYDSFPTGEAWANAKEEELESFTGPILWPLHWTERY